ncbi:MAG: TIGR04282 family arsenosugar biosynthesis glycosyltransferase, partial [Prochlorococcus sp.]
MTKPALVIMARWPAAGRCKRRLAKNLGMVRAAAIQNRLTKHTLTVANSIAARNLIEMQLAITGLAPKAAKRWGLDQGVSTVAHQGNGNLGERMRRQVLRAQQRRHPQTITGRTTLLIGTDLPNLCERDLLQALEALEKHELVIGPANDGGYWLLGLSRGLVQPVASWPFCGIPWGSNQVMELTLQKAQCAGITPGLLRKQNDLDCLDDLAPWQ